MTYVVIENTPGYMPDADEPAVFDTLDAAKEYLKDEVERFCDFLWAGNGEVEPTVWWSECLTHAYVTDPTREHDLGRDFDISPLGGDYDAS